MTVKKKNNNISASGAKPCRQAEKLNKCGDRVGCLQ